jgi:16S rRNA (cytosine1402-N4)-methyltransferase
MHADAEPQSQPDPPSERTSARRPRYRGSHPRSFDERYKELNPEQYPDLPDHIRAQGRTPAGTHIPILVDEVTSLLSPAPGDLIADCTLGYGGHATVFLPRIAPGGRLVGLDFDGRELARTTDRLANMQTGVAISTHRSHFAGLAKILAAEGLEGFDIIFADLGVSSMQLDDPARGFSYKHDGPIDMRMDDRLPLTAADLIAKLSGRELAAALQSLGDEPHAARIAAAMVAARAKKPVQTSRQLVDLIFAAKGTTRRAWREQQRESEGRRLHPAARTFQALRMLVNDEVGGLEQFLRILPYCLRPGGRVGVITFHSGEDTRVAAHFAGGLQAGLYTEAAAEPVTPSGAEIRANPRSRSARFRWGRKGDS